MNSRKARAQAARGKSASPNFLEVGCANFLVCFAPEQMRVACQKNAVARRASFAEGVEGGEKPQSSPPAGGETPIPKGAPKKVNWITVRWTVIQEENPCDRGIFLVRRPNKVNLQGRKPLNEPSKSPKAPTFRSPLIIHHFNQDCNTYPQTFIILPQSQKIKTAKSVEYVEYRQEYLRA